MAAQSPEPFVAPMLHRQATHKDLDALTWVLLDAFSYDSQWQYRFPYAREFPEDHEHFTRLRLSEYLDDAAEGIYEIFVIETLSNEEPHVMKVVAFATFLLPGKQRKTSLTTPADHFERRDTNPEQLKAFRRVSMEGRRILYQKYGENQMKMVHLACHSQYWRRGAGTTLVLNGMGRAKSKGLAMTMLAGSMGKQLYSKLGFKLLATVRDRVNVEDAGVETAVMAKGREGPPPILCLWEDGGGSSCPSP